jgi:hypothetical protein
MQTLQSASFTDDTSFKTGVFKVSVKTTASTVICLRISEGDGFSCE